MKRRRDEELKEIAIKAGGEHQATVYRDKRGRQLDMLNEFMRQEAMREGKVSHFYYICNKLMR
jgi:hypothetical protein